jgi:nucleotide-binding universal stress UspA family protein
MRILYATDGSEGGLAPAHFLASLGHHPDIHVHIVTVLDTESTAEQENCSAVLSSAEAALGAFSDHVTKEIARGNTLSEIVEALLHTADFYADVDLIMVGASGHSAVARFFLGSVAESVARHSRHPVLIVRPFTDPLCTLTEVIVGTDGSVEAQAAAEFVASRFPLPPDSTLRLVRVVPQPLFDAIGDPLSTGTSKDYLTLEILNGEARKKATRRMESLAAALRHEDGGPKIEVEPVALGHPVTELLRIAEERKAGLIVVGSEGLTGIDRFLLGSVSERVMRHAACSVLIVKRRTR